MSISGKKSFTYRFKDLQEQETTSFGFKSMAFAHQATAGDTGIDLTNLTTPSYGFDNPNPTDLFSANLALNKNNFLLFSSSKGWLNPIQSYQLSSTRISFNGFTADQDEVFYGILTPTARSGQPIVDARPIAASGDLAIGATDFNVGVAFKINDNPTVQLGQVLVFRNGQQQFRCIGNDENLEGNYTEVNAGNGLGQIIRFKDAAAGPVDPDSILVVSNGLIAEKPDASQLAEVERINGGLERLIPYVAALAGVSETDLRQYSPTGLDLKSFGDTVLNILNAQVPIITDWAPYSPNLTGFGTITTSGFAWRRNGDSIEVDGYWTNGTTAATLASISLPVILSSQLLIDAAKFTRGNTTAASGHIAGRYSTNTAANNGNMITATGTSASLVYFADSETITAPLVPANGSALAVSSSIMSIRFSVPIVGWTSYQTLKTQLGL